MKKRYGLCICHDKLRSLNAKGLCPIGSKEAREKSSESKGLTVKKKDDGRTERNGIYKSIRSFSKLYRGNRDTQLPMEVQKSASFKKTKIKPYSEKTKKLKKEEYAVFREIFIERPPYCEWCKTAITEFHIRNYHHLKTKGAHPELRLDKNNIVKICFICHDKEHGFKPRNNEQSLER